jgi:transposase
MCPFTLWGSSLAGLGEIVVILELHRQDVNVSAIARRVGLNCHTLRRYIAQGLEPSRPDVIPWTRQPNQDRYRNAGITKRSHYIPVSQICDLIRF